MPRFKDQGICIRHIDWSETSQIVALLLREHGIVRAVAKGAKRTSPSSVQRFSGGIEILTAGQAVGVIKPTSDLANLTEWDLQQPHWHLRQNLTSQHLALYAAELLGTILAPHDAHPAVFDAMQTFLADLSQPQNHAHALLRFQWAVLVDCGYKPQLHADVQTGHALETDRAYTFDARSGGLTRQAPATHTTWKVRKQTIELLRRLDAHPNAPDEYDPTGDADLQTLMRSNRLLCVYFRSILDRELMTMKYVLAD